jgi:hypothetical protein
VAEHVTIVALDNTDPKVRTHTRVAATARAASGKVVPVQVRAAIAIRAGITHTRARPPAPRAEHVNLVSINKVELKDRAETVTLAGIKAIAHKVRAHTARAAAHRQKAQLRATRCTAIPVNTGVEVAGAHLLLYT